MRTGALRAIIVVLLAAAAAAGWWHFSAPVVVIGTLARGPAVDAVYATGVVEPVNWAKVTPLVRGRIVEQCSCEGEWVRHGAVLARLNDDEQRARITELEARAQFLESDVTRYRQLLANRTISLQTFERIDSQHREVRAAIAALREKLADYTLKAPMDGQVLRQDGEVGEVVEPGDVLFWVGQPRPLWIETDVDEEDIPRVRPGQKALIKADAFAGSVLAGTVQQITPKGDPVAKSFRARIALPDDTPLLIGMTTEINIVVRTIEDALLLPAEAVVEGRVFVLDGDVVRERRPAFGIRGPERVQITAGLDGGERVVLLPPAGLADGARVRVDTSARVRVDKSARERVATGAR